MKPYNIDYDSMSYQQYRNTEYWYDLRQEIITSRGNKCERCGSDFLLDVHHRNKVYRRGHEIDSDLIVLCRECHTKEHAYDIRTFPDGKYNFVVDDIQERKTAKGVTSIVVSLLVDVGEETYRVNEWFNVNTRYKTEKFFNAIGLSDPDHDIDSFKSTIGMTGRAAFVKREYQGRIYNNVANWFYKTDISDPFEGVLF